MMFKASAAVTGAIIIAAAVLSGCATKDYVDEKIAGVDQKVTTDQSRLDQQDAQLSKLDRTSREALERAQAAGKLAEGKFMYSMVLSDDSVKFPPNSAELSQEAQARLLDFARKLKSENKNVYIEIQGHSDSKGTPAGNMRMGEERAETVRLFLYREGVPLNRMSTISYGDTTPVAPNTTKEGRAQNRRVVVMVMS